MHRNGDADVLPASPLATADAASAVAGLDHVVIRTPDPERAIVLYAGRLGLDLRLDRSEPAWGARLIFFRCGDLIVEVVHDLKAGIGDAVRDAQVVRAVAGTRIALLARGRGVLRDGLRRRATEPVASGDHHRGLREEQCGE